MKKKHQNARTHRENLKRFAQTARLLMNGTEYMNERVWTGWREKERTEGMMKIRNGNEKSCKRVYGRDREGEREIKHKRITSNLIDSISCAFHFTGTLVVLNETELDILVIDNICPVHNQMPLVQLIIRAFVNVCSHFSPAVAPLKSAEVYVCCAQECIFMLSHFTSQTEAVRAISCVSVCVCHSISYGPCTKCSINCCIVYVI